MTERQELYDYITEKYPKHITPKIDTFEKFCLYVFWWPNGDFVRITWKGVLVLKKAYTCHEVSSINTGEHSSPSKHFLFLSKFCRKPYYIGKDKIIFFDEEEALLFKLCDGDVDNVQQVSPEQLS